MFVAPFIRKIRLIQASDILGVLWSHQYPCCESLVLGWVFLISLFITKAQLFWVLYGVLVGLFLSFTLPLVPGRHTLFLSIHELCVALIAHFKVFCILFTGITDTTTLGCS